MSGDHSDPYDADFAPGALSESDGEEMDMEAEKESGIFFFGKPVSAIELDICPGPALFKANIIPTLTVSR